MRISERWLWVARVALLAISVVNLIIYAVGTPAYFAWFNTFHRDCLDACMTSVTAQSLRALGIPIPAFATYWVTINLLFALTYFVVAALIFWRKPDDRMAWLASFSLVALGASFPSIPSALADIYPAWWLPVTIVGENVLAFPSLFLFFFLFPNGHFVPRWTQWAAIGCGALFWLGVFIPASSASFSNLSSLLLALAYPLTLSSLVFAQVYRYRHVSTPIERQQTKWIVFGTAIGLLGFLLLGYLVPTLLTLFMPFQNIGLIPYVIGLIAIMLVLLLIPLSLAFALLRYRLWDVDVLINKTLVYSLLTGTLVAVYAGCILGLHALLHGIINQDNTIAIVISTLAIAALFQPLRRRIQRIIDRRFFRSKYDAAKIVAAFSATLRHEIDLNQLSEQLVAVVQRRCSQGMSHCGYDHLSPKEVPGHLLKCLALFPLPNMNQNIKCPSYKEARPC